MYDPNFPPPATSDNFPPAAPLDFNPPPPPSDSKHSKLGIASFILAILSLLVVCGFFIFAYSIGSSSTSYITDAQTGVGWALMCLIALMTVTGVVLGIIALTKKTQSKLFGILGLVLNGLIVLGFCGFIVFAIMIAGSL